MSTKQIELYLKVFTEKARMAGLDMAAPGQNWAPMKPLDARGGDVQPEAAGARRDYGRAPASRQHAGMAACQHDGLNT